jgi:hypothetical protein
MEEENPNYLGNEPNIVHHLQRPNAQRDQSKKRKSGNNMTLTPNRKMKKVRKDNAIGENNVLISNNDLEQRMTIQFATMKQEILDVIGTQKNTPVLDQNQLQVTLQHVLDAIHIQLQRLETLLQIQQQKLAE